MADSKIPVEIEVRLDERSVGVSMESLKSRVKAQGRDIGKALGDAVRAGMGNFDFQGMSKGSSGSPSGYKPDPIDRTRSALERLLKTQELYDIKVKNGVITQRAYATGINNTIAKMDQLGVASTRAYVPLTAFEKAPTIFGNMHDKLRKVALVTTEVTRAFFGLAAAGAAAGAPAIISTKYLATIEDAKVGIAGTLQAISEAAGAGNKWNQSMIMSEGIINQLTDASVKYNISLDEISDTFRGLVGVGSAAGMSLQEVGRIATLGTMAVKSLNLNKTQTLQELRDLLQPGGIQAASSTLATALNITNEMTKKWKEAGTLFQELEKRITGYSMAAIERQNTLSGSFDILKIKIQRLFSDQGGFDVFKKIVKDISDSIGTINYETGKITFNKDLVESMKSYWTQIKAVASVLGTVAEITIKLTPTLVTLGQAFTAWFVAARILPVIYTGLVTISSTIAALPALFGSASAAMMTLGVTASAVGSKMGLMSAGAAGGLIGLALFGTYLLADHLGLIDQIFSTAENRAKSFRDKIKGYDVEQLQYRKMRVEGSIEYIEKERDTNPIPRRYDIDGTMMFTEAALKQLKSNLKDTDYQIKQTISANEKLADNARIQQGILAEAASKDLESKRDPTVKRALAIESANRILFDSLSGIGQAIQTNNLKEGSEEYAEAQKRMAAAGRRYYAEIAEANRIGSEKRTKQTKDALKEAIDAYKAYSTEQDTLVQEGAVTFAEAYNNRIKKIDELSAKTMDSSKWGKERADAEKIFVKHLTEGNEALKKEIEQIEESTRVSMLYGESVKGSAAALAYEKVMLDESLSSHHKAVALIHVELLARKQVAEAINKMHGEYVAGAKQLEDIEAEGLLMFMDSENQKIKYREERAKKMQEIAKNEALDAIEKQKQVLDATVKLQGGTATEEQLNKYKQILDSRATLEKLHADRTAQIGKIASAERQNAELKDAKETVDKIEGTFKELFVGMASEGGKNWKEMLNKFKTSFKTDIIEYIYKQLAKPFVLNVIASVTGAMGMSGVSQAAFGQQGAAGMANGGSGILGTANNLWTAYRSGEMMNTLGEFGAGASAYYGGASQVPGMSLGVDSGMLGNVSNAPGAAGWGATAAQYAPIAGGMAAGYNTAGRIGGVKGMAAGAAVGVGTAAAMGAAGSMMAGGTAAAGASSAMGTLSAMGPVGWVAAAVLLAYSAFSKKGGGPQIGEYGGVDEKGYKSSFTASGGDPLNNKGFAEVTYGQAQSLYAMVGLDAGKITLEQGYGLDPQGDSPGKTYRNLRLNGKTLTGDTFDGNNGAQWYGGNADTQGAATYLSKLTNSEIEALVKAIDNTKLTEIMAKLKANFSDLTEGMAKYQTAQATQKSLLGAMMTDDEKQKRHLAEVTEYLNKAFADINMAVPTTTEGFRNLIDGVDLTTVAGQTLLQQLGAMGDAFLFFANAAKAAQQEQYGWQIKLDIVQGKYTEQQAERFFIWHAAANDSTRAIISQVWALEDQKVALEDQKVATDAATESLKEMQAVAMEGVDNAFGELVSAYESEISAKESLIDKTKDYIRQLKDFSQSLALGELSTLDPLGKYQAAKSAFDAVSQRAMSGDSAAIGQLQGVSEAYLQASREYYASNVQYADDYNKVQSAINKTVSVAEQQVDSMDAQLITMRRQLSSLTQINESTKSVESAITRLQTALLEAVRVGNIGDVSEQAKTASGLTKGGAGELYNPLTDTWSNKGQSATTSQIREWGAKILSEQGPMALYDAVNSVGLSLSSVNVIAGWEAGTAENWVKANIGNVGEQAKMASGPVKGDVGEQAKMASGLVKGGAGELYNPLTDTWSNKGQSATTSQIREWAVKILDEQGPMALYEATKSVGLSMSSVNTIVGWEAGTAENWAKANNLPTFANGGFVKPGWAMVGERGPELVNFATQARVYTADQTSRMISGSGDNEVYLQQVIAELQALIRQNGAASQAMIAELQQVKAELEDLRSRTRLRDGTNG